MGTLAILAGLALATSGCPETDSYDLGFEVGFAEDDWYWTGYYDGYDTVGATPFYYQGSEIPYVESPLYDAGYYDGVWYAYNDGYFVDYDYAFTVGFSEGYDAAFYPGYLDFLEADEHIEYANGGWGDGYNDGFTEGSYFGANDFEQELAFDWLDAMMDYRSGTDIYFEELDEGTGAYGDVYLYEYGTDPADLVKSAPKRAERAAPVPAIRNGVRAKADIEGIWYRPLTAEAIQTLNQRPEYAERSPERPLTLQTTWLQRVEAYQAAEDSAAKILRARAR